MSASRSRFGGLPQLPQDAGKKQRAQPEIQNQPTSPIKAKFGKNGHLSPNSSNVDGRAPKDAPTSPLGLPMGASRFGRPPQDAGKSPGQPTEPIARRKGEVIIKPSKESRYHRYPSG